MEKHNIDVYAECPYDKLSQCRLTLCYALINNSKPIQYHTVCHSYHDGSATCQKCIVFFSFYIDKYGVPKERQVITPQIKP